MMDDAEKLEDMAAVPGNRLEALAGDRNRSAWAFKFGDCGGSFTDFTRVAASVARDAVVNGGSRS